jgi:hypothetical protein
MDTRYQKAAAKVGCEGKPHFRFYNITTQDYNQQRSVNVVKGCNGFTVKNAGTSTVFVDGVPVLAKESLSVGGNEGEIYVGRIDITFGPPAPSPTTNSAWVIQKFYVDENFV